MYAFTCIARCMKMYRIYVVNAMLSADMIGVNAVYGLSTRYIKDIQAVATAKHIIAQTVELYIKNMPSKKNTINPTTQPNLTLNKFILEVYVRQNINIYYRYVK